MIRIKPNPNRNDPDRHYYVDKGDWLSSQTIELVGYCTTTLEQRLQYCSQYLGLEDCYDVPDRVVVDAWYWPDYEDFLVVSEWLDNQNEEFEFESPAYFHHNEINGDPS